FNIMSEGIHARRTWMSYKFALRNQADAVGIISVIPAQTYNSAIKTYSKKEIVRELSSILYYKFFFNKRRYRKKLIQQYPSV
ncbi:unnamed protein product, partial [marine sediment metagenome]